MVEVEAAQVVRASVSGLRSVGPLRLHLRVGRAAGLPDRVLLAAGAIGVSYLSVLDGPIVRLEGGAYGYARVVAAASPKVGGGHLLVAGEAMGNDGPWTGPM